MAAGPRAILEVPQGAASNLADCVGFNHDFVTSPDFALIVGAAPLRDLKSVDCDSVSSTIAPNSE